MPSNHVDQTESATGPERDPRVPLLELRNIHAGYGRVSVLRGVDFTVQSGSIVAVLGANGSGKSTLLQVVAGVVRCTGGSVHLEAEDITRLLAYKRAKEGVCLIPGGEGVFRALTVRENLILAAPRGRGNSIDPAIDAFPRLGERLGQVVGTLSGGEQQMLAVARAYLSSPRIILADELSLGLAPLVVDQMFESIKTLSERGIAMVIVEQYAQRALEIADTAYIMVQGSVSWRGNAADLDEATLAESYLGRAGVS